MGSQPVPAGGRVRCESCGTEAIVLKAEGTELACCDRPMTIIFEPADKG